MILRRLTKHVQDQNWFAVGLDFIIVVAGILLAFQITNWSEARGDRSDARVVLERLEQDFEQILERTDISLASHTEYFVSAGRLIQGIRNKKFEDETLFQDMMNAAGLTTPPGPSATFTQLVSSGRLELIRNQDLRRALTEYDAYLNFIHGLYPAFERPLTGARHTLMQASTLQVRNSPTVDWDKLELRDDVDRDMLMSNSEMMTSLQTAHAVQDNVHALLYRIRGQILDILEQIRAEQETGS